MTDRRHVRTAKPYAPPPRLRQPPAREVEPAGRNPLVGVLVLLVPLVGVVAFVTVGIIFLIRPRPATPAPSPAVAVQAVADRAEAERVAAERAAAEREAHAREVARQQIRAEYTEFRKGMLAWVKAGRSVTLLLRSAPSPAYLHRRIREANDRLTEVSRPAYNHVFKGPDGPVAKSGDVIGTMWVQASGIQGAMTHTEYLAELYMSTMRSGLFTMVGPLGETIATVGRMFDEMLDEYDDLLKGTDPPTIAQAEAAVARIQALNDEFGRAVKEAQRRLNGGR
ncbi:MAG TPA: hypothetical protein VGF55_14045 [Gemmataceae bacterium]|jgi:hypothetical protein